MEDSSVLQWAPDDNDTPRGEQLVRLLTLTARQNGYSRDGVQLWKQNSLSRKRARRDDEEAPVDNESVTAASQVVHANIHQLVQSCGFDFTAPKVVQRAPLLNESTPTSHSTPAPVLSGDLASATSAVRPTPLPSASDVPVVTASPAPAPTSPAPAHAPLSSLAKLVARAKAQQPSGTGDAKQTAMPPPPPVAVSSSRGGGGGVPSRPQRTAQASGSTDPRKTGEDDDADDDEDFGVVVPGAVTPQTTAGRDDDTPLLPPQGTAAGDAAANAVAKHPSQMTREEYLGQFKRAPRRGEIGQDADVIMAAEKLGYVMSGSRSKGSQMYVDRNQRQLHEREAAKLQQQFRKVEDARQDDHLLNGLLNLLASKRKDAEQ